MLGNYLGSVLQAQSFINVEVDIYRQTHELKERFTVKTAVGPIRAYNTGAFQQLIDGRGLEQRAAKAHISPREATKTFENESLPPCYTAVIAAMGSAPLQVQTVRWHTEEDGKGEFVLPSDLRCR